jgi:glycosyltransferase involved in cell wall biosynthesis
MVPTAIPKYSIITTCKGRLGDLKRTLPMFLKQADTEVVVVDFDCPDGTEAYVRQNHPAALVVKVNERPRFNLAEARNIGAKHASGAVFVFLDADILVKDDFLATLPFDDNKWHFGVFEMGRRNSIRGSCLIRRSDFITVGGYDELLAGYMGEDTDLYMKLKNHRIWLNQLPVTGITEIFEQDTAARMRFYDSSDLEKQYFKGQLYSLAKEMALRTQYVLDLNIDTRKQILKTVDEQIEALYAGSNSLSISMSFSDPYNRPMLRKWEISYDVLIKAKRR